MLGRFLGLNKTREHTRARGTAKDPNVGRFTEGHCYAILGLVPDK
jgi:hypothetical protein